MQTITLFLLLASVAIIVSCQTVGVRVITSSEGVNEAIRKYTPDYEQVIVQTTFPEVHITQHVALIGDVDVSLTNIKVSKVDFGSLGVTGKSPNLLTVTTNNAAVTFSASWAYRQQPWPHLNSHGTADGFAENVLITGQVLPKVVNGKFNFTAQGVTIDIKDSKVNIHGGVVAWVLNLLEGLFRSVLRNNLEVAIADAVTKAINNDLNALIQKTTFSPEIKLPKENPQLDWIMDFSVPDNGLFITEQYLSVASSFTSYPTDSHQNPPFTPVPLPTTPISPEDDANVFVSDYAFNSAAYVLHNAKQLHYAVLPSMVPPESPIKFNTTAFKLWLPQLYEKFPNKAIRIDMMTTAAPHLSFTPSSINLIANTSLLFSVYNDETTVVKAFLVGFNVESKFSNAAVNSTQAGTNLNLFGKLEVASDMKLIESYIGDVNVTTFGKIMQLVVIGGQVAALNKKLAVGLPIDLHKSVPGLIIDRSKLIVNDGFVAVTAHATYIPPVRVAPVGNDNVSAVMQMLSQMMQKISDLESKVGNLEKKLESKCTMTKIPVY